MLTLFSFVTTAMKNRHFLKFNSKPCHFHTCAPNLEARSTRAFPCIQLASLSFPVVICTTPTTGSGLETFSRSTEAAILLTVVWKSFLVKRFKIQFILVHSLFAHKFEFDMTYFQEKGTRLAIHPRLIILIRDNKQVLVINFMCRVCFWRVYP